MQERSELLNKLDHFINKYYKNLLIRGIIYFVTLFLSLIILLSFTEHLGQFNKFGRLILFCVFMVFNSVVFWRWIVTPIIGLYRLGSTLSYIEAANIIGSHFSSVQDKLINLLQLQELSKEDNQLVEASIQQKIEQLRPIPFAKAIDFKANKNYLKYAIAPILVILGLFITGNQSVIVDSSTRIISYNKAFMPVAPFQFSIKNASLETPKGHDFLLEIIIDGEEIPMNSHIVVDGNSYQMPRQKTGHFSYLFKNPQNNLRFSFLAGGFSSNEYELNVVPVPIVLQFECNLKFPSYVNKKNQQFKNIGNLEIPQGTIVKWIINTKDSQSALIHFDDVYQCQPIEPNVFQYQDQFYENTNYSIYTKNDFIVGDSMVFKIDVVKDEYPFISVEEYTDSIQLKQRFFEGVIDDDYGLSQLTFNYQITGDTLGWLSKEVAIDANSNRQVFIINYDFDQLGLAEDQDIEYYFEVWDNDAINGTKSTKSSVFSYKSASSQELEEMADAKNRQLKNEIDESIKLAEDIQSELKQLREQLLEEKDLSWNDKQKTKNLFEKQKELKEKVKAIQEEQQKTNELKNEIVNEELLKKQEEIQRIFDNLLDQEMEQMIEELNEMMDEINKEDLQELLESMQKSDHDLEKDLDRTLELFKQMEVLQKIEKNINKLKDLANQQKELSNNTEKNNREGNIENQERIQSDFENIQEELEKARQLNEELEFKQNIPDTRDAEQEIKENMQESLDKLQKNMKKQAAKKQNNAAEKMEEMGQMLQSALDSQQKEQLSEDMQTLRQILENLVTLSIDQEDILESINSINLNSPLYLDYLQLQNKLQSDTQIIEDSLFALSKRQPQIQSVVNKEINAIYTNMSKALEEMAERRSRQASEKQQFAMTSANNLALLLSEALEQMQKEMSNMQSNPSSKMCNKPNSNGESMKQMQKGIKEQMKEMLKNKKAGRTGPSSKELAQLAAQQELVRQRMSELRKEMSGDNDAKKNIDLLSKQMEENEADIINNNITLESIKRQESIMTRLLEAEKAEIERQEDKRREANEWMNNLSNRLIEPFEDYLKEKQKQEELLQTIPPSLTPFYKQKVQNYFKDNE